jgi:hypothetical protein
MPPRATSVAVMPGRFAATSTRSCASTAIPPAVAMSTSTLQ